MATAKAKARTNRARPNPRGGSRGRKHGGKPRAGVSGKSESSSKRHKLTRSEIEAFLEKKAKIPKPVAQGLWRLLLLRMRKALLKGHPVALTNIGTLEPFVKQPTRYRHPETGEMQVTPRRRHVRFVLSPSLKDDLRRTKR